MLKYSEGDFMSNIELTLLSLKDLINMKALKNYGLKAECTDLALITGGVYYENEKEYDTLYWTRTTTSMGSVYSLNKDGKSASLLDHERRGIIRPVLLNYNNITKETFIQNEEIELGEYPQYAPSKSIQRLLERKYQSNSIQNLSEALY